MILYTLPKIWQGRIKKFWDRTIPGDFPASKAKFDLKFDTQDETDAVAKFEEELGTEESVVIKEELIPEGTFVSGSLGIYDVNGPRDEKVLLNPERVTTTDPFVVLHYEDEEWKVIEDVELVQGYIWGTVPAPTDSGTVTPPGPAEEDNFSPIAVVFYKKDIETVELDWFNGKIAVANGNSVKVYKNDEDHIVMVNLTSGSEIDLTADGVKFVAGGTVDGSNLDSTSVSVVGVDASAINFYAGSLYYSEEDDAVSAVVNNANISIIDSKVRIVTASIGMVRINNYNASFNGVNAMAIAAGQTTISKLGKDVNISLEDISMSSAEWVKNANISIDNSEVQWLYTGGNSGYSYTINSNLSISNSKITGGLAAGGSNGRSDNVNITIDNVESLNYASANRGIVDVVNTKIKNSTFDQVCIYGDTDSDTTGAVNSVSLNIDKGTYKSIILGKNFDKLAENADNVNYVKISRAADYTISQADLNKLGDKFIVK